MACFIALTLLLWHEATRWSGAVLMVLGAPIVFLIGLSRIYLGVHWPTDVLGGWTLAISWVSLAFLSSLRGQGEHGPSEASVA
jgi:undecaprenyl-diphosphatase